MSDGFRVVVPARYESSRLPGKVLLDVAGKPLLQYVWQQALASGAAEVVIATDSERVREAATAFGADVCMTGTDCASGTDRVAEVCRQRDWDDAMPVVNLQGDAPLMPPASVNKVARLLMEHRQAAMATLCTPLRDVAEYHDPHVVKVVFDAAGRALYFSRAPIPAAGHGATPEHAVAVAHRHLGLYAYRPAALRQISAAAACDLERLERLEQLRALWLGLEIRIAVDTESHGPDVDTEDDLRRVQALLAGVR